eukprot:scaffold232729_cov19-Prasinocladus_malaysianus.AAC.1
MAVAPNCMHHFGSLGLACGSTVALPFAVFALQCTYGEGINAKLLLTAWALLGRCIIMSIK